MRDDEAIPSFQGLIKMTLLPTFYESIKSYIYILLGRRGLVLLAESWFPLLQNFFCRKSPG